MRIEGLPMDVVSRFTDKPISTESLYPEELEISRSYDQKRLDDFARGRHCAHQCLGIFNQTQYVGQSADGCPIWPKDLTGSISHSQHLAGAMLSSKDNYLSIGLDIEKIDRITPDLWPILYTENELQYLSAQPASNQSTLSTVIYSLKEAYYKMQFPLFRIGMEHNDIEVSFIRDKKEIIISNKTLDDKLNTPNAVINYNVKEAFVISYVLLSN